MQCSTSIVRFAKTGPFETTVVLAAFTSH